MKSRFCAKTRRDCTTPSHPYCIESAPSFNTYFDMQHTQQIQDLIMKANVKQHLTCAIETAAMTGLYTAILFASAQAVAYFV